MKQKTFKIKREKTVQQIETYLHESTKYHNYLEQSREEIAHIGNESGSLNSQSIEIYQIKDATLRILFEGNPLHNKATLQFYARTSVKIDQANSLLEEMVK